MAILLQTVLRMILMVGATILIVSVSSSYSGFAMKYVESPIIGNFFQVWEKNIDEADVNFTVTADNTCGCRITCWLHSECVSVSVMKGDDGKTYCRLTDKSPTELDLIDDPDAIYIFWPGIIPNLFYGFMEDGLFYFVPDVEKKYNDSKTMCERIPGHRLGYFKNQAQAQAMLDIHQSLHGEQLRVDLVKKNGQPVWPDGSLYKNTEGSSLVPILDVIGTHTFFRLAANELNDYYDIDDYFICQANPFDLK